MGDGREVGLPRRVKVVPVRSHVVERDVLRDEGEPVVRRQRDHEPSGSDVQLSGPDVDAAPVGVDAAGGRGPFVVRRGVHRAGDEGVDAIGTDDDRGAFLDRGAARVLATDAHDSAVFDDELLDGETGAQLGAGLGGGVGQQRVEDRAADAHDRVDAADRGRRALEHHGTEVEPHRSRERCAGCAHTVEQTPSIEPRDSHGLDRVSREHIAREGCSVEHEHPSALAGQEHGGRRTRAAASNDNCVVHLFLPWIVWTRPW